MTRRRIDMHRLAWLLLVLLLPCFAWAQEEAAPESDEAEPPEAAEPADTTEADEAAQPAEEPAEESAYAAYEASGFGFSIRLPEGGVITDPASEDWNREAEVAFEWTATTELPITLILGRVEHFESQLDTDTFGAFCDALLSVYTSDDARFTVVTSNKSLPINGRGWNLIEVTDVTGGQAQAVHFSVFSTYAGDAVYTVAMYYLEPLSREVQEFGIPVIYGFDLTD
jgi:hypothetical protein